MMSYIVPLVFNGPVHFSKDGFFARNGAAAPLGQSSYDRLLASEPIRQALIKVSPGTHHLHHLIVIVIIFTIIIIAIIAIIITIIS
jgi:hypothetical protein